MDKLFRNLPRPLRYASVGIAAVTVGLLAIFAIASGAGDGQRAPATPTPAKAVAPEDARPFRLSEFTVSTETPTPTPTPEPEPTPPSPAPVPPPPFAPTAAVVVTTATTYSGPSAGARPIRQLYQGADVSLVAAVSGQNWIIGDQDWVPVEQPWERTWYQLDDGSYIYRAFVYFPDGESPFAAGEDRYVIVDVSQQTAWAMDGARVVREIPVTSGKAGFETPVGQFRVIARIQNERMTSERAGITGAAEQYDVHRVLFTQYFADGGYALHLNYWQPLGVYGSYPTSHGCVGIPLADAQFLWLFGGAGMRVIVRDGGGATPAPAPPPPSPPPPPAALPTVLATATPAPTASPAPTATPTTAPATTVTSTPAATSTASP